MVVIYIIIGYVLISILVPVAKSIIVKRKENKYYKAILKEYGTQALSTDIDYYFKKAQFFEDRWNNVFNKNKIILKDGYGDTINLCPKCGGYMKIVHYRNDRWYRKNKFLGCSNYPDCKSSRDYDDIYKIKF
jgi:hypothetical protein